MIPKAFQVVARGCISAARERRLLTLSTENNERRWRKFPPPSKFLVIERALELSRRPQAAFLPLPTVR